MLTLRAIGVSIIICMIFPTAQLFALDNNGLARFESIKEMTLDELGDASARLVERKYPGSDWDALHFPNYVYSDLATEMAYKVAVKRPHLLGMANIQDEEIVIPCYCTCGSFGHENLLYCFYENGDPKEKFDEHGAQCAVCIRQALLAFLWDDLGATHPEIMEGMKDKFAPLIEKFHNQ